MPFVNQHPVVDLSSYSADHLRDAFDRAVGFAEAFDKAIGRVVRVIHSIPKHHRGWPLNQVSVYLGRSTLPNVSGRFRAGLNDRRHSSGTVLFRTKGAYLADLERVGLLVLSELKRINALCVANIDRSGVGPTPTAGNEACVYLTWGETSPVEIYPPSMSDLRDVARNVAAASGRLVTQRAVLEGLSAMQQSVTYCYLE
ncbi:MAG: hypothetical protein M5U25_11300 [Planctomycetota bacterium]|nr:hypothetical protein [Planctomycetota bacterium]